MKRLSEITVIAVFCLMLKGCFGPSEDEISRATTACEEFIKEEFQPYTHVFDTWGKDGNIVVEIGYNDSLYETKYSVRLCVVDLEAGRISVPSVFNMNEWKK